MANKKNQRTRSEVFQEHASFLLPLIITFVGGIFFALVSYYGKQDVNTRTFAVLLRSILEALIPTATTYVLCEIIHNIVEILNKKTSRFIWNALTLVAAFLYNIMYFIYLISSSSLWLTIIAISTLGLLGLTFMSYREIYIETHRDPGLI